MRKIVFKKQKIKNKINKQINKQTFKYETFSQRTLSSQCLGFKYETRPEEDLLTLYTSVRSLSALRYDPKAPWPDSSNTVLTLVLTGEAVDFLNVPCLSTISPGHTSSRFGAFCFYTTFYTTNKMPMAVLIFSPQIGHVYCRFRFRFYGVF